MYEVLSIGEALMDFIPLDAEKLTAAEQAEIAGLDEKTLPIPLFEQSVGGSPANVACALARLGVKTGFVGKVGRGAKITSLIAAVFVAEAVLLSTHRG